MTTSEQTRISISRDTTEDYPYKVSIIVPCYNTKPWLDECLQSLVDQTLQEIEIICINDGSTDGAGARLNEWQTKYPKKIKVIHQANGGLANARNAGMKIAQGECIGFVDSDDFVDICMYEKLYIVLKENNADSVRCSFLCFNDGEDIKLKNNNLSFTKIKASKEEVNKTIFAMGCFFCCGYIHKKSFLDNNNIKFQTNIRYLEDNSFAFDMMLCNPKVFKIEHKIYFCRGKRIGRLTSDKNEINFDMFKVFEHIENKINIKNQIYKNMFLKYTIITIHCLLFKINKKYKIDFFLRSTNHIFRFYTIKSIYNILLFHKYRKISSYPKSVLACLLLHFMYIIKKTPLINKIFDV
jgi:glycosyltransferase involved in cell wall biosynthesis